MLKLSKAGINNAAAWKQAGIELPKFDLEAMVAKTKAAPAWVHFGAGNIFRGYPALLQQRLLEQGKADTGIVAVETYDHEIIDRFYTPYDNLGLLVIMNADGSLDKTVVASVSEALVGDPSRAADWARLEAIFRNPSLQMASFTITEKGYSLSAMSGEYLPDVAVDIENGPRQPKSVMGKVTALAFTRYQSGQLPIAFVSMDNCSHNGEKLRSAVETIAKAWAAKGLVDAGFPAYLGNPAKVSFPWSMIDKITPRPSDSVKETLNAAGFTSTEIVCTAKNTYIAPFVNAEGPQYLVIEDHFPAGRPQLELSGVYFTDRQTVDRVEKMKVCTCLNPLHTSLAVFGCLLGHKSIADEMKDADLKKLVEKIGYEEGLPVVVNPGILDPRDFIKEVIELRLPNPYIPDTPQRIACDTSQKLSIRFGETIKAYRDHAGLDPKNLKYIPLVLAAWCRYLMALDDAGQPMTLSPDPLLATLTPYVAGIKLGDVDSAAGKLAPILKNERLFAVDLYAVGLGAKVEAYFGEMIAGKNAVRATLHKYLG
jgi:fructuronate reductase